MPSTTAVRACVGANVKARAAPARCACCWCGLRLPDVCAFEIDIPSAETRATMRAAEVVRRSLRRLSRGSVCRVKAAAAREPLPERARRGVRH